MIADCLGCEGRIFVVEYLQMQNIFFNNDATE